MLFIECSFKNSGEYLDYENFLFSSMFYVFEEMNLCFWQSETLSIWISADGKKSHQKTLIEEKARNICRMVERAKITDKGARYIINHVLFPVIEYLLNNVYLNTSMCKKINSICLKTFKHKARFAQTAINSIFHLKEGYNIFDIEDRQLQLHIKNFNDRINRDDLLGESTKIRLQQFQNWLWTDKLIFDKNLIYKIKDNFNLNAMIISKTKEKLIVWESTYKGKSIITIPSGGKYTFKQLWEDLGYEEKLLHKGLRENGIMFVEQIMNLNFKDILDWHHIQTTRPKRGKPPGWYTYIDQKKDYITNMIQDKLRNLYAHNLNTFNNLTKKHVSTKKLWIAHKENNELIIGKENICRMVERAKITDKGARYIINHVLFPVIEYLLNNVYLNTSMCKKINSICLKTFKHKARFAQTAINSIFHLKEGYNIFDIEDRQLQLHIKNFNDRINRDDLLGESTKIRLQQFQNWLWTDKLIFDKNLIYKIKDNFNLNAMIISKAKEKLIVWESTYKGKSIITIPSGGKYTFKQLWEDLGYEEKLLHKGLRENGIMFVEQIMNLNFKDILDWHHIQTTRPKRGKPPGWYTYIDQKKDYITNMIQDKLRNLYAHNLNTFNNLTKKHVSTKKLWIAHKENNELIIRKEYNRGKQVIDKRNTQKLKHYNIVTTNLELTSVLLPCEGCEINTRENNEEYILDWHHIQTTRPKRGKPPGWYTYIDQKKDYITNMIQDKLRNLYAHNLNTFNNLTKKHVSTKKLWIAHKENNELIIGKEYKRGKQVIDKRNTQKLKHYNIVTTNLELTSVLLPCEGCEINTRENNEECVYRLDKNKEDKIGIPVIYSKKSTSNMLTKSFKNRIRMNVKDLYRATAIMENFGEENQENNTYDILLNIIDEEDIRRENKYYEIQKWINCENKDIRELL
ncbi:hypothetical protein Glove_217g84 [Diversispora epigaea]|uniref:Uncharacterized protein n=1 Tax=Diversispora epigaea TaxID=1348612 RepID=A0A397IGW8_9GLOM|nr:hypothetical protein Glove_217g84 [Diversispora epigaea]